MADLGRIPTLEEIIAAYGATGIRPARNVTLSTRRGDLCGCPNAALACMALLGKGESMPSAMSLWKALTFTKLNILVADAIADGWDFAHKPAEDRQTFRDHHAERGAEAAFDIGVAAARRLLGVPR
jgi:hypothetical protein